MDNKLTITRNAQDTDQVVFLEGRLDASWSAHLDDYLDSLVREGAYRIILNMEGVQYLSSAGIRILVNQYKKISAIGGHFIIRDLSQQVAEVLKMVGMLGILTQEQSVTSSGPRIEAEAVVIGPYRYVSEELSAKSMTVEMTGDPTKVGHSGYGESDNRLIRFSAHDYGLGLGAIGNGFDDCSNRYGEFLAAGGAAVYKPSDGSKVPDYTLRSGSLEPEIQTLYAIRASGAFSARVVFEPTEPGLTLPVEELVTHLAQLSRLERFVFLMIAETGGLVGVSLNASPVGGTSMFEFPALREKVHFTTEPAYPRMLAVAFGVFDRNPDEKGRAFMRPVGAGQEAGLHLHAAVFPFQALSKKENSAGKQVIHLFETSIVEDVLHLIADTRGISGLGSSTFKQGVAWIGKY